LLVANFIFSSLLGTCYQLVHLPAAWVLMAVFKLTISAHFVIRMAVTKLLCIKLYENGFLEYPVVNLYLCILHTWLVSILILGYSHRPFHCFRLWHDILEICELSCKLL